MGGRQAADEEGRWIVEQGEEGEEEVNFFTKRKWHGGLDETQMQEAMHALRQNAHFQIYVEHLHHRREAAIRAMQMEKAITCGNRHFMESGKLEALDELLDDMELWSGVLDQ